MARSMDQFGEMHFDIMKEIGNIGTAHAVASLAKMIGKTVKMSVPVVEMVDFADIANFVGGEETMVAGILINISGDINGMVMFIVKLDVAQELVGFLMGRPVEAAADSTFSEIELSALQEIGNILGSSYLGALTGLIKKKIKPSTPALAIDMANAVLSVPAIAFGKISDKALLIESIFGTSSGENISGYFLLVPDMPSFNVILESLGVA